MKLILNWLSFVFFVLICVFVTMSIAEAKVYRCVDENGKKTYSQTMCRTEGGTMERKDFINKQPVMNDAERIMRAKNNLGMSIHYAKVNAAKREIQYQKEAQRIAVSTRNAKRSKTKAFNKKMDKYYRNASDDFRYNDYHSPSLRRQSARIADHFSAKARNYRGR
jgi:hypothetical protein